MYRDDGRQVSVAIEFVTNADRIESELIAGNRNQIVGSLVNQM